jgi:hypothetical protein
LITPDDLRNPLVQSGYDHVNSAAAGGVDASTVNYWRASTGPGKPGKPKWRGPVRSTPIEAAWDYCAKVNSGYIAPTRKLKSAGHKSQPRAKRSEPAEVVAARGMLRDWEAQQRGDVPGYVYLITDGTAYKIGYSTNPAKRVAELQTGNPRVLRLVAKMRGTEADEKALHSKFHYANLVQEWFRPLSCIRQAFIDVEVTV